LIKQPREQLHQYSAESLPFTTLGIITRTRTELTSYSLSFIAFRLISAAIVSPLLGGD
jgi:hypothetical protein